MKKTILITGGSGLVGHGIKSILSGQSESETEYTYKYDFIFLSSKNCNLEDYTQTFNYFNSIKPYYVIHLAANVGGLFKNMNYKVDMLEKNVLINMNVLKASHNVGVKKLVACLSTCIFPDKTSYPIDETILHSGPPHFSNDAYAYAKRLLDTQCRSYREQYGDNFVSIIPTNIYGPNDNYNLEDAHVIPALIHKCKIAKAKSEPFIVAGTGKPLRQFIYSDDLAKLIMWVLLNYNNAEPIILSVGEDKEVSIGYIASLIAKKYNYLENLVFDSTKSDGQYKKTASNAKLMNLIGTYEFIDIEVGIEKSIDWFEKNYEICRK
jgi:GDP-L-fucose synthase